MSVRIINDRKYIPGPGIYKYNGAKGRYRYIIPADYAVDCYQGDACQCDINGTGKPPDNGWVIANAEDFGARVSDLPCYD